MKREISIFIFLLGLFMIGIGPIYYLFGVFTERFGFAGTGGWVVIYIPLALIFACFPFMRRQVTKLLSDILENKEISTYIKISVVISMALYLVSFLIYAIFIM
ncbi:MAG: hypothetical protein NTY09_08645 [bacterium]|nr:hypothetical protein [bacterium]